MSEIVNVLNLILVALGFGFVIFWHELGHFLAAKWAGVRVEQFAVGFGNALVSFRKGLGIRFGTSGPEYAALQESDPARAAAVSPTEYRLNYIPLGGYVKMHGQEDMVASADSTDADHYMNKSVGKRMVIISAGVVMNVILAAVLFTLVYFVGLTAPAATVGEVLPNSPAQRAGLNVGDTILAIDGEAQYDFTNVALSTALLRPDRPAPFLIQPAGTSGESAQKTIQVVPSQDAGQQGMVGVGVGPSPALRGADVVYTDEEKTLLPPDALVVAAGERIVEVAGQAVDEDDYFVLDQVVQNSGGEAVPVVVERADGRREARQIRPRLAGGDAVGGSAFAGLAPLVEALSISPDSPAQAAGLRPGDVVEQITIRGAADTVAEPSFEEMKRHLTAAGRADRRVDVSVRRDGERVILSDVGVVSLDRETGQYGLGFAVGADPSSTRIGGVVDDSPAARAGLPASGRVVSVNDAAVSNWFDVRRLFRDAATAGAESVDVTIERDDGEAVTAALPLTEGDRATLLAGRLGVVAALAPLQIERQTRNPAQALWWGVRETRDQILKLYLTLRRVIFDRTVPASNLTGPVGIAHFGTVIAQRGYDWVLWFLAMISANLAVVNFLPIPILDGGHMVFLIGEKLTGRPPSAKIQTAAMLVGLVLLLGLVLFVTYNDISRLLFS